MPKYIQPAFDLSVGVWRHGSSHLALPDLLILGNLSPGRITGNPADGPVPSGSGIGQMWLRVPAGSDIRDSSAASNYDSVEVPYGSGRFYSVTWVDDIGSGFPNEHRFAVLYKEAPWPVPFPSGGGGGGPTPPLTSILGPSSSGGAAVTSLALPSMSMLPMKDFYVSIINVINQVGIHDLTVDGIGTAYTLNPVLAIPYTFGAVSGTLNVFYSYAPTVGVFTPVVNLHGGDTASLQAQSWYIHFPSNILVDAINNSGSNVSPPLEFSAPGLYNLEALVAAFCTDAATAGVWSTLSGQTMYPSTDINDTVLGQLVSLRGAYWQDPVPELADDVILTGPGGSWAGTGFSARGF